jgi:hypothetical protein
LLESPATVNSSAPIDAAAWATCINTSAGINAAARTTGVNASARITAAAIIPTTRVDAPACINAAAIIAAAVISATAHVNAPASVHAAAVIPSTPCNNGTAVVNAPARTSHSCPSDGIGNVSSSRADFHDGGIR